MDLYSHFTTAYVAAANAGNAQARDLTTYGTADGGGTAAEIGIAAGEGIVAAGTPTWAGASVTSVAADGGTAAITGCFTAGDWHYVKKSTGKPADPVELNANPAPEPLRPGEKSHPYQVTARLQRHAGGGGWFVLYVQAHPEQPC